MARDVPRVSRADAVRAHGVVFWSRLAQGRMMVATQSQTVLVAGPGGIGRDAIAERLVRCGLRVAFSYNAEDRGSVEQAHALRDRIRAQARLPHTREAVLPVPGIATRMADVQAMVMAMREALGPPEVLVTLTPPARPRALLSLTEEDWTHAFSDPVKALWLTARAVVPTMIEHGSGHIINVLSSGCHSPAAQLAPHCASQGAGKMFTRALARECAQYHIAVNAVATPMLMPAPGTAGRWPAEHEAAAWTAVARTVEYLLLSAGEGTTGQTIVLGGEIDT